MATADTAEEVIELFCNSSWYNRFDREVFYVTTKVRKDLFLKYVVVVLIPLIKKNI